MSTIGILLYDLAGPPRDVFAEDKYRVLAERMSRAGWQVRTLGYRDNRHAALRSAALQCDVLLVWINPIERDLDRTALDSFLRGLADEGLLVSAHPDAILKIGTKDVLVATQSLSWSVDACAYRSVEEFRTRFPGQVRRNGIRVLKQYRGNGGDGVWKITPRGDDAYEVQSAIRGTPARTMKEHELVMFASEIFARGSHLIDQGWVDTLPRGMVRAYLCGDQVTGFGYQEINALYPTSPDEDFTRQQPSRRHYYTEQCHLFQGLRQRLEREWITGLCACVGIGPQELPLVWDADFLLGDPPRDYLLCEINASCVSPFPDSVVTPLMKEIQRRLAARKTTPG
jgi:hypothetical protein